MSHIKTKDYDEQCKIPFIALILAFSACKSGSASSQEPSEKQDTVKIFNLPQIPVVLNTVEQRTDYMVKHYWDRFDFSDTTYISQAEVPEQAWVDYCDLLEHVLACAQTAMKETSTGRRRTGRCFISLRNWPINICTIPTRLCATKNSISRYWKP